MQSGNIYRRLERYDKTGKTGLEKKKVMFHLNIDSIEKLRQISKRTRLPMSRIVDCLIKNKE